MPTRTMPQPDSSDAADPEVQKRIHVDAAICGGHPHIRGTRVRVSDILDLLASGVPQSEILVDYPYLTEADLHAAVAFRAVSGGISRAKATALQRQGRR